MRKVYRIILNVLALGGAVVGSALIASNTGNAVPGYICFLLSSFAGVILLRQTKEAPMAMVLQNVYFIGVNLYGLIRWS